MKYTIALLLAASIIMASPVKAGGVADLARANCIEAIVNSGAQVTRGDVKKFNFAPYQGGYILSGLNEKRTMISCLAAADGHTLWVHGG